MSHSKSAITLDMSLLGHACYHGLQHSTVCIDKGIHSFFNFREFGGELKIKKLKIDFWDSKTCPSRQN